MGLETRRNVSTTAQDIHSWDPAGAFYHHSCVARNCDRIDAYCKNDPMDVTRLLHERRHTARALPVLTMIQDIAWAWTRPFEPTRLQGSPIAE